MNDRRYYSKEAAEAARNERAILAAVMFATGLGVGVIVSLLFAPAPGEKVRKEIVDHAEQGWDAVTDTAGKAREAIS